MSTTLFVYAWLNTQGCPDEQERLKKYPTAKKLLRVRDYYKNWSGFPKGSQSLTVFWPGNHALEWTISNLIEKYDPELNRLHILPLAQDTLISPELESLSLKLDSLEGQFPVILGPGLAIAALPDKKLIFSAGDMITHLEWIRRNLEWERGPVISYDPSLFYKPEKSGFSFNEGPIPEFADYTFFWGLYPESRLEMDSFSTGKVLMALSVRTVMSGQRMAIFINGNLLEYCRIENSENLNTLKIPVDLRKGPNEVLFRYESCLIPQNDPRPLAVLFSRIEFFPYHQVPERIK